MINREALEKKAKVDCTLKKKLLQKFGFVITIPSSPTHRIAKWIVQHKTITIKQKPTIPSQKVAIIVRLYARYTEFPEPCFGCIVNRPPQKAP